MDDRTEAIQKLHEKYGADFYLRVDYGCDRRCQKVHEKYGADFYLYVDHDVSACTWTTDDGNFSASCCDGRASKLAWAKLMHVKNATLPDGTFHPWHMRPFMGKCYICRTSEVELLVGTPKHYQRLLTGVKQAILHALGFGNRENFQKRLKIREIDWKVTEETSWKKKVAYYTGPHTRDAARAHFGCPDLDGAEVEDVGEDGKRYAYWDKRAFGPEIMTGKISHQKSYFSNITAAFLRDSSEGWYEVDDSMIDHEAYWYGKNKTCEFAMKSCRSYMDYAEKDVALQKLHAPAMPYCSEKNIQAWFQQTSEIVKKWAAHMGPMTCSSDRSMLMQCHLTTREKYGWNISHYGYFYEKSEISKIHGYPKMLDFCPVFMPDGDSLCSDGDNQPEQDNNFNAELYGDSSLCFEQGQHIVPAHCRTWTGRKGKTIFAGAGCYKHKCSDGRLMIQTFAADDSEEIDLFEICKAPGEEILIRRRVSISLCVTGTILCPKCEDICEGKNDGFKCAEPVYGVTPMDKIIPEPVDPVIPEPVDPFIPEPVDPFIPEPVDPVIPEPVDPVIPEPVDPAIPTSSGSGNFPCLVISMMVILMGKRCAP